MVHGYGPRISASSYSAEIANSYPRRTIHQQAGQSTSEPHPSSNDRTRNRGAPIHHHQRSATPIDHPSTVSFENVRSLNHRPQNPTRPRSLPAIPSPLQRQKLVATIEHRPPPSIQMWNPEHATYDRPTSKTYTTMTNPPHPAALQHTRKSNTYISRIKNQNRKRKPPTRSPRLVQLSFIRSQIPAPTTTQTLRVRQIIPALRIPSTIHTRPNMLPHPIPEERIQQHHRTAVRVPPNLNTLNPCYDLIRSTGPAIKQNRKTIRLNQKYPRKREMTTDPPTHIDVKRDKGIAIAWNDGSTSFYSVKYLRRLSPSAEQRKLREEIAKNPLAILPQSAIGNPGEELTIQAVEPVGRYALKIIFSDGHNTGIYSWEYLRDIDPARAVDHNH